MQKLDQCDCHAIHSEIINGVEKQMPQNSEFNLVTNFFKMFADFTRLKILSALSFSQMCVCDISVLLNSSHSSVSHQLKRLKQERLVKSKKEGKIVFYSLDDEHIYSVLNLAFNHINEK